MSGMIQERDWIQQVLCSGQQQDKPGQPDWLKAYRHHAREAIASVPMPHRKQESWRYTSTERLFAQGFETALEQELEIDQESIRGLFTEGLDAHRLVFVNGRCTPPYCVISGLPSGVHVGSLSAVSKMDEELVSPWLGRVEQQEGQLFGLLNNAMMQDGLFLHLDAGVKLDKPIEVFYVGQTSDMSLLIQPRGLVVLEAGAEATLIEHFVGDSGALYFNNNQTEIVTQQGAQLRHYRIQDESTASFHMGGLHVLQGESSQYDCLLVSLGASWARTEINTRYDGQYAQTQLNGLYLVGDQQTNDVHLNVHHNLPACDSRESFRGLLYGKGRAVFDGRIEVAREAQKTQAHLSNANLMLTRDAEVDTKPQLEIYADDVQCSHGTTVGQIEDDQLFYLRSRGVDEGRARTMLSLGFAAEVIEGVQEESLKAHLMRRIEDRLNAALADE
jgi:Fe-S cluster assembly protein SufD